MLINLGIWSLAVLAVLATLAAASMAGAAVAWRGAARDKRAALAAAAAEATAAAARAGGGAARVDEAFTVGWLNLLLQALWTPVLEKHVAGLASELLTRALDEARVRSGSRAPWRYIDAIHLEQLGFGLTPPSLSGALASYDPTTAQLVVCIDVRFVSSSAQAGGRRRRRVLWQSAFTSRL